MYFVYLLRSLEFQHVCYVGFTTDPKNRILQHNGIKKGGARKTVKLRPWEMLLHVRGFTSKIAALQFEWAFQHPFKSRTTRNQAVTLLKGCKTRRNPVQNGLTLCLLLSTPPWKEMPLELQILEGGHPIFQEALNLFEGKTGLQTLNALTPVGPTAPPTKQLVCQTCREPFVLCETIVTGCPDCQATSCLTCLAPSFQVEGLIPPANQERHCQFCGSLIRWKAYVSGHWLFNRELVS